MQAAALGHGVRPSALSQAIACADPRLLAGVIGVEVAEVERVVCDLVRQGVRVERAAAAAVLGA